MEFVLMTTTSTPDTSRSGSVMKFGDYREGDEEAPGPTPLPLDKEFLQIGSDSDDEDNALIEGFNELSARTRLVSYDCCTPIILDQDQQKGLQLVIGTNVSEENPWKQIRKLDLLDYLPDDENAPTNVIEFRSKLADLADDASVLVGFAAAITDTEDPGTFLFYVDTETAKESISLIRQLEAFERQRISKALFKVPRPWESLGSEIEVDLQVERKSLHKMEVEIQRLYSSNRAPLQLSFRFAEDVRDGYVELVPKQKPTNVYMRRTVSIAVQSAAHRIETEQQTDPTFPSNAWSQYSYELPVDPNEPPKIEQNIEPEINEIGDEDNEENEPDFIGPSDAMKELLRVLEFNSIDMYRDDYAHIALKAMKRYSRPIVSEVFCFIDPKWCPDRFVNAFSWHPTLSGIFAASYTYKTMNSFARDEKLTSAEISKKSMMLQNPVMLWSFDDTLYPKLILESPREVTFLSFCPYDVDILIGGLVTGQLIIWDLKNCLHRVENPEELTDKQEKNREKMHSLMAWSKFVSNLQPNSVHPVAISHYELSQKKVITSIKWLNRKHSVASTGLIEESIKPNELFRQFVTSSLDGTIAFWDLDYLITDITPVEMKRVDAKRKASIRNVTEENISSYEKLNGTFRPIYATTCQQPISCLIFDEGLFRYKAKDDLENAQVEKRIEFTIEHEKQEKPSNRLLVSSLLGSISTFIWEGFLYKEGKPEKAKQIETFASIHNGPVLMVERNPFIADVFLSIGQKIFAIWSENNQTTPVLWRRRDSNISCAQWSPTRVSLFFIARSDGHFELWELLTRTDDACISYNAGTTLITVISQHKLSLPIDILIIADKKANVRAFELPPAISQPSDDDCNKFKEFISNELKQKEKFSEWQQAYIETNKDLAEQKELLREESRRTIDPPVQLPKATKVKEQKRSSSTAVKSKPIVKHVKSKRSFDLSERLRQRWEEMNVKRLMKSMLVLKQFDPETITMHIKPERDRIAYNLEKKHAIEENFRKIHQEVSEIRARLIPPNDIDQEAERLQFITTNVDNMCSSEMDGFQYASIEMQLQEKINASINDVVTIDWHELLLRAQKQRFESNKDMYERKRKAYIGKCAQIDTDTDAMQ